MADPLYMKHYAEAAGFLAALPLDDIRCLRAARTLDDLKLDLLALVQGLEAFVLDRGEMNEHVAAVFPLDKSVPFFSAEPFDFTNHD